ncbi:hypothetical protein PR002_g22201 [Phytophthora rubi]|uniref:RxLR effector protein n=1 Tax=Phytophthora rubi TaxID=129364 RepID=A0A6A3IYT5_9STRA|nr:hypothetical protein PR002_g22201 [Phytophthora rubi]
MAAKSMSLHCLFTLFARSQALTCKPNVVNLRKEWLEDTSAMCHHTHCCGSVHPTSTMVELPI